MLHYVYSKPSKPAIRTTVGHRYNIVQSLQWSHNGWDGVSNHQPHDCLLNRLIRRRSKKTSQLRVTGLCAGNSPVTGEFPSQMVSNAENVFIDDVIMTTPRCIIHSSDKNIKLEHRSKFDLEMTKPLPEPRLTYHQCGGICKMSLKNML